MFEISKTFRFEAAHSLPHLPKGHPCRNIHGHSYRFEVVCRGELDDRGFVIDYAEISEAVAPIVGELDHCEGGLNAQVDCYTTAENLARYLFERISAKLDCLHRIDLYETAKTRVTYPTQ